MHNVCGVEKACGRSLMFYVGVLTSGCVSLEEAKSCYDGLVTNRCTDSASFEEFLEEVNANCQPIGIHFIDRADEVDGNTYIGYISSVPAEKWLADATSYDIKEISYLVEVVSAIMNTSKGSINKVDALNLRNNLSVGTDADTAVYSLPLERASELLDVWQKDRFLAAHVKDVDELLIGVRSFIELSEIIGGAGSSSEEELACPLCKHTVSFGIKCDGSDCPAKIHMHCRRNLGSSGRCTLCKQPWPHIEG